MSNPDAQTQTQAESETADESSSKPTRSWTTRLAQPVAYNIFTGKDQTGKEKIFFKLRLPDGQTKPDEQIIQVFRDHKKTAEGYPSGLYFDSDRVHGPVWKIQNDPLGRSVADKLMVALDRLAARLESSPAAAVS